MDPGVDIIDGMPAQHAWCVRGNIQQQHHHNYVFTMSLLTIYVRAIQRGIGAWGDRAHPLLYSS